MQIPLVEGATMAPRDPRHEGHFAPYTYDNRVFVVMSEKGTVPKLLTCLKDASPKLLDWDRDRTHLTVQVIARTAKELQARIAQARKCPDVTHAGTSSVMFAVPENVKQ